MAEQTLPTSTIPPVFQDPEISSPPPPPPGQAAPPSPPPPPPPQGIGSPPSQSPDLGRKSFPKKLLIAIPVLLVFLGIIIFIINNLLPGLRNNKEITLTWWGLWEDEEIVAPLIQEYQQSHPNVKIQYVKQSKEDYRERLSNALAQGKGPDIFRIHNTWVPMFRNQLSTLPSEIMTQQEFAETFFPVARADLTTSGGIVGIPLMYDGLALFINEDIFNTFGKTPPTNWNELRQTARELTIKDERGIIQQAGIALGTTENVDHWPEILALLMIQNGASLTNPTGALAEGALNFYTLFFRSDRVWDNTLPPSTQAFASGKLAMYIAPSWRVFEIKQQNPSLKFKILPVPQVPKDDPNEPDITYATYWVEAVWDKSPAKQQAWEFLKFLSEKENLEKLFLLSSQARLFGELYPRQDMRDLLLNNPNTAGFVSLAHNARSWYLASRTFDGPTGINSQINKYFADAINAVNSRTSAEQALATAASGVQQVLVQYGILSPPAPTQK